MYLTSAELKQSKNKLIQQFAIQSNEHLCNK